MLVLSRRVGESVVIGNDVVVTVLEVRGDVIRVGIEAPREVPVHRSEVHQAIAATRGNATPPGTTAPSDRPTAASATATDEGSG